MSNFKPKEVYGISVIGSEKELKEKSEDWEAIYKKGIVKKMDTTQAILSLNTKSVIDILREHDAIAKEKNEHLLERAYSLLNKKEAVKAE